MKSLESYIFERQLTQPLSFDAVRNARIGIDVNNYITRLLRPRKEVLADAVGGIPATLLHYVRSDVAMLKEYDVEPVFVFSGNDTVDTYKFKTTTKFSSETRVKSRAWNAYNAHEKDNKSFFPLHCGENFKDANSTINVDAFISDLIQFFIENELEYIRAPYASWAQLGYLYEQNYIHAIYGPTELVLLSNIDKFIISMDFSQRDLRFVDKMRLFNEMGVNQQQIVDIAVAIGCDLQPQTIDIFAGRLGTECFDIALGIIQVNGTIYSTVAQLPVPELELFQRGIMSLQHMPVLKNNGRVEIWHFDERKVNPSHPNLPPQDLYEMFSVRIPQEYYFYQSIGLIHNKILESIANEAYVEKQPLDGLSLKEYKDLVAAMLPIKAKEVNLLTKNMNRYFQFKTVKYTTFWGESMDIPHKPTQNVFLSLQSLTLRSVSKDFTLDAFFDTLKKEPLLSEPVKTGPNDDDSQKLHNNFEVLATSLLRTLNIFDLYSTKTKSKALEVLPTLDPRFQEKYILLLAFFKYSGFQLCDDLSQQLVGDSRTDDESLKRVALVVARLGCFIQANQRNKESYSGPVSRALLAFRSSLDLLHRNLRELFETTLVSSLAGNEVDKVDRDGKYWCDLVHQMPFANVPNTVMGLVVQTAMDQYLTTNDIEEAKKTTLNHFSPCGLENLSESFDEVFEFIREAFKLVVALKEDGKIGDDLFFAFSNADYVASEVLGQANN